MSRSQFVVPQFIDVEPKILGPITARQFLITLGTVLLDFIIMSLAPGWAYAAVFGIPVTVTGIAFAFVRVNGQPFHYIALNMVQTLRRPSIRVWDKRLTDSELRVFMTKTPPPAPQAFQGKPPLAASRLSELTLVVDTGGVYQSDQE
jgi:hypothetical protein